MSDTSTTSEDGSPRSGGKIKDSWRKKMSHVNMPNGDKRRVTVPARKCEHNVCDFSHRLIVLRKEGSMGRRERRIVCNQMKSTIQQHALQEQGGGRFSTYDIVTVEKVVNPCLWKRFREKENEIAAIGYVNQKMLFHGSKTAKDIVARGFDINRANAGGMFGPATYFAEHSSKSNQYAYGYLGGNGCPKHSDKNCYVCPRQMILCRVALGKMEKLKNAKAMQQPSSGFHSVKGEVSPGGLMYPEYAVYSGAQIYPEYLITYKIVR